MFLFCFVLFFFSLIFQADTSSILFHLVVENLILHIFLIIMIIMPCSGMFRNVPGCSGMFHVPGFIDAHSFSSSFDMSSIPLENFVPTGLYSHSVNNKVSVFLVVTQL